MIRYQGRGKAALRLQVSQSRKTLSSEAGCATERHLLGLQLSDEVAVGLVELGEQLLESQLAFSAGGDRAGGPGVIQRVRATRWVGSRRKSP
ncbi:MAG: hypothetical protein M3O70_10805 [Actinomycetota bacterium]|nr:hypothetical protein [Actinomycetota bacterium]